MVLEHLFPEDWIEKQLRYAFLLAVVYSTVSIFVARLLFGANSGLVAVVFTSILLLPYLQKLFRKEEIAELREKSSFKVRAFLRNNLPAVKLYGVLFIGIYLTFMFYSFLLPFFGLDTGVVFREQLSLESGLRGNAYAEGLFIQIFLNNWWVLLACFMLALVTGDGAIFFITWNASTWGAIFGFRALAAANAGFGDPLTNLATIFIITLPHVILEGGAYILAAIAGAVISEDVVNVSKEIPHFLMYLLAAILGFLFLKIILGLVMVLPSVRGVAYIFLICGFLWLLSWAFLHDWHRRVFQYNVRLFYASILLFLIGALVETWVLSSSTLLLSIYSAAV